MKKFDDGNFLNSIAEGGTQFTPIQIIGMMIASAHTHYLKEHQDFLRKLHGLRDNPIYLTRMIENELKLKFNGETGEFEEPEEKSPLGI